MQRYLSKNLVQYAFYGHPDLPLVYINNPKAACSTIKTSLWAYYDKHFDRVPLAQGRQVHIKTGVPFLQDIQAESAKIQQRLLAKPIFSVVRNPYSRILSSYRNKVLGVDPPMRDYFCQRFMLLPEKISADTLPFSEFLKLIAFDDPLLRNAHFRSQSINLLLPFIAFDFIGHIENMEGLAHYFDAYKVGLENANMAAPSKADAGPSDFDPETIELIQALYADDFINFGYALDPSKARSGLLTPLKTKGVGIESWLTGTIDSRALCLAPELIFYHRFMLEQNDRRKMELVVAAEHTHKNRGILTAVLRFLNDHGETVRAKAVKDQLRDCNFGHLKYVSDKNIIDYQRL